MSQPTISPYTSHGHLVDGFSTEGWPEPNDRARCGGPAICKICAIDAERIRQSVPASKPKAIDADPEFFHGLTMWGKAVSVQVRENAVIIHPLPGGPTEKNDPALPLDDARRLRDLLNVATARGYL